MARAARARLDGGSAETVVGLQLRGLCADLARGALITAVALLVLTPIVDRAVGAWRVAPAESRAVVVGVSATVAVAAAWKVFHTTRFATWFFVVGVAIGAVLAAGR